MSSVLSVISAVFWGALLLSVLVFLHEGGHYLVGRAFGMRATEFFLGMPCRLKLSFRSKSHGTEFGVTPLLLGGYTKICGMEGLPSEHAADVMACVAKLGMVTAQDVAFELNLPEEAVASDLEVLLDWGSIALCSAWSDEDQDYTIRAYRTLERDAQLRSIYDKGHDFSLPGSTKAGEPHALIPQNESALSRDAESTGIVHATSQAETFLEREKSNTYLGKGFWPRFFTLVAGPAVNIVLGLLSLALVLSITGVESVVNTSQIAGVTEGSIAEEIGMKPGDTFVSIAGYETDSWADVVDAIDAAAQLTEPFEIVFHHEGSSQEISATVEPGRLRTEGYLGITATTEMYHPPLSRSLAVSWSYVVETVKYVVKLFIPTHTAEVVSNSSSVVGISVMASEAAQSGASDYVYLMAAVSLSLGVMNLIPIPPLDGGKILIEIIGVVRKKPVSIKWQERLSLCGLAFFLLIFVVALHQDILRFVIGG